MYQGGDHRSRSDRYPNITEKYGPSQRTQDHDTDTAFAQFEGGHRGAGGGRAIPGVPTPSYMTRARSNLHNAGAAFPDNSPELENRGTPKAGATLQIARPTDDPLGDYTIDDGWVVNSAGQLMFWVPPWLRDGLYFPRNTLVICPEGTTKLEFSRFVHGTEWQKCIDPKFENMRGHSVETEATTASSALHEW
ncbi:hypothetical protein B0H19DRAFT_1275748 [Mycena capillaripes]|nr:hypothetical protein B0H19DRAFT_1275748 [Mycena capillaripes]